MTLLTILGMLSVVLTVGFTLYTYFAATGFTAGQTRRSSLVEAWVNVCIGFSINFFANLAIFPLLDAHISFGQNFWMGCIYTAISVLRSFAIRRWFNDRIHAFAARVAA